MDEMNKNNLCRAIIKSTVFVCVDIYVKTCLFAEYVSDQGAYYTPLVGANNILLTIKNNFS